MKAIRVIAALVSAAAGVYLLTSKTGAPAQTVFDVLMHGIGLYFIARGLWMLSEVGAMPNWDHLPRR